MSLELYNTATRSLEAFNPSNPHDVKIYTCGPTVYNYQHIGNYAAYIYWDLLLRTLELNRYSVRRILNLTDVGHLTSDADIGEDKMLKTARLEHRSVQEVANFYAQDFLDNFSALNLIPPYKITRAIDYISACTDLVDRLLEQGIAYEISDGIYFDTSKFPAYPNFARLAPDQQQAGARVDFNPEKRHLTDFALWKFVRAGEDHPMQWQYLDRPGYPGWHIECSAIIHSELGEPIDIHTGGIDHIPVHHTNEIAQTAAAFGEQLANYWLHCNFITIEGEKISKSLGNVYTLKDLAARGFSPMDFKLWVLSGHYQTLRNFSFTDLAAAQTRRLNWRNRIALAYQQSFSTPADFSDQLRDIINRNLASPAAFAYIDQTDSLSLAAWHLIDQLFGLNLINDSPDHTATVQDLIERRASARASKDFAAADQIRANLAARGLTLLDAPTATFWQYA